MHVWLGRFLFGFGMFLAIAGAVIRRTHDSVEFLKVFGVPRWTILIVFAAALASIGVGSLILKSSGDLKSPP